MWKNKHVVIALIVAPILAILAWYAVGTLIGEKPHAAESGKTYKLVARSNCRYASGACDLHNADFKLSIRPEMLTASSVALDMSSSHALQSAAISLFENDTDSAPAPMTRTDEAGREWQGLIPRPSSAEATIRVAVTAQGATWFAEVPVIFLEEEE
jgi:hypothetical protein